LDVLRSWVITPEQIRRQTRRVLQESSSTNKIFRWPSLPSQQKEPQRAKTPMVISLLRILLL
jgi:hypothetical protein